MTDLKSYAKQEDAVLDAAWLGANGIDAIVVDESGYGGNLLAGTLPGSVRLQVNEDKLADARDVLAAKTSSISQREEPAVSAPKERADIEQRVFRAMILLDALLFVVPWLFPDPFVRKAPETIQLYFESMVPSKAAWENSFDLWGVSCLLSLLSFGFLWFFLRAGRVLYVLSLICWTTYSVIAPNYVMSVLGALAYSISCLLGGALLAQMYLGSVGERFRKTHPAQRQQS